MMFSTMRRGVAAAGRAARAPAKQQRQQVRLLGGGQRQAAGASVSAAGHSAAGLVLAGAVGLSAYAVLAPQERSECLFGGSAANVPHEGVPGTVTERTFLAIKPDGVQRGLIGKIIARFEDRGYQLVGLKLVWPTKKMAEEHYADLSKKPFYKSLTEFFSSGPIVCMCWQGKNVILQGRAMLGETNPQTSAPGSIRGDYSIDLGRNIIHGSDSPEAAKHELTMWFKPEELHAWPKLIDSWVYESGN